MFDSSINIELHAACIILAYYDLLTILQYFPSKLPHTSPSCSQSQHCLGRDSDKSVNVVLVLRPTRRW